MGTFGRRHWKIFVVVFIWNSMSIMEILFFEFISKQFRKYICCYGDTRNQFRMDVARILVRSNILMVVNETLKVEIDDIVYPIKIVEETYGPLRITMLGTKDRKLEVSNDDLSSDSWLEEEDDVSFRQDDAPFYEDVFEEPDNYRSSKTRVSAVVIENARRKKVRWLSFP